MTQPRTASAQQPPATGAGKLAGAVLKGLTRMLEALGLQPQLRPVPVRVGARRLARR